jgi:hypothetical protein
MPHGDAPGRRNELVRVFGVDAAFDRMAADLDLALGKRQLFTGRHHDLRLDDVNPVIHSVTGCSTWTRVFISMK